MKIVYILNSTLLNVVMFLSACSQQKNMNTGTTEELGTKAEPQYSDATAPVGDLLLTVPDCVKPLINVWMRDGTPPFCWEEKLIKE